mmetsp:Transcript_4089/g.9504  ORF Transcript_4089/g.9504 Transcript_4089/m.9504 type:complete len:269 (-) Transcript_4089:87-893(-)
MDASFFADPFDGIDFGPVTREELDDWYYNMVHEDADGENYQFRGGYGNHCNTTVKIQRCLKGQDMSSFVNLLEKKARYPHMWQPSDQSALDTFENKLLSSTKEDRDKVAEEHAYQREEDCITGQRVREKSSGRLGLCVAPVMGVSWPITFDDGEWPPIVTLARDEVDVLCKVCSKAATQRCLRCKAAWYCCRECQSKDWKKHKKECKEIVVDTPSATAEDNDKHACALCKTEATSSCSRCKKVWYCGRICQREHWKEHKPQCKASKDE